MNSINIKMYNNNPSIYKMKWELYDTTPKTKYNPLGYFTDEKTYKYHTMKAQKWLNIVSCCFYLRLYLLFWLSESFINARKNIYSLTPKNYQAKPQLIFYL